MNIIFEKFTEKHIDEAVDLALSELEAERSLCPDIPSGDFSEKLKGMLTWLSSQPIGKAAFCDEKMVGYLLFGGPWDGFFGNVKGVYSPLGASAFSYEYADRQRLASMLFESTAQQFVQNRVFSCAVTRYAHDLDTARAFVFNGFGIRCSDAVRSLAKLSLQYSADGVSFIELPFGEFEKVSALQMGLVKHLEKAPIFCPTDMERYKHWFHKEDMRVFTAASGKKLIGFISVDVTAENFITEHDKMANICGAYFDENCRGKGIAQVLLAHIRDTLSGEGITHLGVDCETMNPTALNFWGKYFTPYTYSFARRLDERIETMSHN